MATIIQTWSLSLQRDEKRQVVAGDADHLSAIQSTMMQYLGLYLSLVSAKRNGLYRGQRRPATFWFSVALLFPFIAVVIYPSHRLFTQFFIFLGAVASNFVLHGLLQMNLSNEFL